jgi:hypothetical protein
MCWDPAVANTLLSALMGVWAGGKILLEAHVIKKVKGGYKVLSEKTGKNLGGPYKTREEAAKRLRQVEFFKHNKG